MTEILFATLFALSFAIAIYLMVKNRLLNEKIEQLTTLDDVTGLKNQSATLNQLEQSFELAKRYSLPLTLALVQVPELNNLQKRFGNDLTT
ncbi:MAG: hypothetical protein V2I33_12940, partial [Kangiellaceae bacterium]|nr:hypothetical protein [Kangiellaceae bacterium]